MSVIATSHTDPTVQDSVQNLTTVLGVAGVDIGSAANEVQVASPGTQVTYVHPVTNTGNYVDNYTLQATRLPASTGGFALSLNPTSLNLSPGVTQMVTLTVSVPLTATAGQLDYIEITVRSQSNLTVSDSSTDVTISD
jgi:uncharacterized membrane protein